MFRSRLRSLGDFAARNTVLISSFVVLIVALVPVARVFFRIEIDYNEGWNVYNADAVANHQLLYPLQYGFTDVNYPMLSFYLLAQLHRITHDYLYTARIVSLLSLMGSCLLIAAIIRTLKASRLAACLASLFCFAVFCADADFYIGIDDPQMLAQLFFLAGLFVYIRNRRSLTTLIAAAALFVLGGFTKHNLVDIPLAVLIDLAIISRPRALWFSLWGLVLTVLGVLLNIHAGGPYFLTELLAPRAYSLLHVLKQFIIVLGPLLFPLVVAIYTALRLRHDANRRIASILLATALLVDVCFSGGNGVSINALFTSFLAISILVGLFIDGIDKTHTIVGLTPRPYLTYIPVLLFLWLGIPFAVTANWPTRQRLRETVIAQSDFSRNVAWLKSHPGPALCESLLLCAYAQKPYVYDPFNATRLIRLHKLDPAPLIEQIQQHRFAAIQLSDDTEDESTRSDRFTSELLAAIYANYTPVIHDKYAILYEPKSTKQ
jgi:hypothetical protein